MIIVCLASAHLFLNIVIFSKNVAASPSDRYRQLGSILLFLQIFFIGSDRRPETKQGIEGKIVKAMSDKVILVLKPEVIYTS